MPQYRQNVNKRYCQFILSSFLHHLKYGVTLSQKYHTSLSMYNNKNYMDINRKCITPTNASISYLFSNNFYPCDQMILVGYVFYYYYFFFYKHSIFVVVGLFPLFSHLSFHSILCCSSQSSTFLYFGLIGFSCQ